MAKRIIELEEDEVCEAVQDFIHKKYPEMVKPGTIEVILHKDGWASCSVTWKIVEKKVTQPATTEQS